MEVETYVARHYRAGSVTEKRIAGLGAHADESTRAVLSQVLVDLEAEQVWLSGLMRSLRWPPTGFKGLTMRGVHKVMDPVVLKRVRTLNPGLSLVTNSRR